ncbi:MAG: hypothetical protein JSS02_35045, partial [Planctomycetes bacterium]|nr:hypothetical protein [Planctomycetota bacterium]
ETPPAPGKVVLITLQDYCTGLAKRLQVLGADLENLHLEGFVARQRADKTRMPSRSFDFSLDLQKLQQELDDFPSIRLLVVDPLCDFCQGPAHVAQMLTELRNMAQILDIPVVVTLPAQTRFDAAGTLRVTSKYRNDAARAVWCLATDPKQGNRRFFIPRRTNHFALPRGVEFQIDNQGVKWHPEKPVDPADPLGWETRLQGCLNQLLRNGPQPSADVMYEGQYRGFSPKQIRATAFRMGVEIRKRPGFGKDGGWEWSFPGIETDAQNAESLENAAGNVKNAVWALDATGGADETTPATSHSGRDSRVDWDSPAPVESVSNQTSAKAKTTDTQVCIDATSPQNVESLENAAGNAKSVVVASAATGGADQLASAAPPSGIDSIVDFESPSPVQSASHQASAEAKAADGQERIDATSSQNVESLENAAGNGVTSHAQPLTKRERRKQARRARKLVRKARERGAVASPADVDS